MRNRYQGQAKKSSPNAGRHSGGKFEVVAGPFGSPTGRMAAQGKRELAPMKSGLAVRPYGRPYGRVALPQAATKRVLGNRIGILTLQVLPVRISVNHA